MKRAARFVGARLWTPALIVVTIALLSPYDYDSLRFWVRFVLVVAAVGFATGFAKRVWGDRKGIAEAWRRAKHAVRSRP